MIRGTTCPQCRRVVRLNRDGVMRQHKSDRYAYGQLRGGRVRQDCPYGGVTPEEARAGVTWLGKRAAEIRAAREAKREAS